ncbi:MAG: hypothetical protein ACRDN0_30380 [Trebonia sp.]
MGRRTTDDEVAALLTSLETSSGTFTAPALGTVVLDGLGAKAVPALKTCLRQDIENQWGSASFIAAVLDRMLTVARRLAETLPAAPPSPVT